jgi:regulatory protein
VKNQSLTLKQAMLKAAAYCAYQERCYKEVETKLAEWGIYGTDAGELLIELANQNYLNEERFAKAFAGGKFRTKKWGRVKIRVELKARNISDYCIRKALLEIDEQEYTDTLREFANKKLGTISSIKEKYKVLAYLQSKGYEPNIIWEVLNE